MWQEEAQAQSKRCHWARRYNKYVLKTYAFSTVLHTHYTASESSDKEHVQIKVSVVAMSARNPYKVRLTEFLDEVVNVQNGDKLMCCHLFLSDNWAACLPGTVLTVFTNPRLTTELTYTLRNSDGTFEKMFTSKELKDAINCGLLQPTIDTKEKWIAQRLPAGLGRNKSKVI